MNKHKKQRSFPVLVKEKYILTNENWCGYFQENKIRVRLIILTTKENRVCLWGTDDFGMEKDFPENQKTEAREYFDLIDDFTTQEDLRKLGFVNA